MRHLGAGVASALLFSLALTPLLSALLLGWAGAGPLLSDPGFVAATLRGLLLAEMAVLIGWPAGVLAAFAIWGSGRPFRRMVLGAALLVLLMPPVLTAQGVLLVVNGAIPTRLGVLAVLHAAPAAGIATLTMTGALNRLDPVILRSAAGSGASRLQTWRLVLLPVLAMPLAIAAAAGYAFSLGLIRLDSMLAPPAHPTLGGLLGLSLRHHDVVAPAQALVLYTLILAPLAVLALLTLLRRHTAST